MPSHSFLGRSGWMDAHKTPFCDWQKGVLLHVEPLVPHASMGKFY